MDPENPTFPTPPPQPVVPSVPPVFPKKNNLAVILLSFFLLITLLTSGYLFLQVQSLTKQLSQLQVQPTPTPLSTEIPSPTTDPTADWKIYLNTKYGFQIKFPTAFKTEVLAAGGTNEADADSRNFFIYQIGSNNNYEERYINFEITQIEPAYQGTISQTQLGGLPAKKIILPNVQFDIYSVQVKTKEFLEIYVSSNPLRGILSNQILSTLKFTE